jgi:hypothetical protein
MRCLFFAFFTIRTARLFWFSVSVVLLIFYIIICHINRIWMINGSLFLWFLFKFVRQCFFISTIERWRFFLARLIEHNLWIPFQGNQMAKPKCARRILKCFSFIIVDTVNVSRILVPQCLNIITWIFRLRIQVIEPMVRESFAKYQKIPNVFKRLLISNIIKYHEYGYANWGQYHFGYSCSGQFPQRGPRTALTGDW